MRNLAATLLATCVIALGAAPALAADTIGISFDKIESFREPELKYLMEAVKKAGLEAEFANAQESAQRQASQVQGLVSKGVKAIIAIPWDIEAAVTLANDTVDAGVPFITMDQAPSDTSVVTYHVGSDPCADGKAAGEFFVKAADGKTMKLLELQGSLSNDNGIRRSGCLGEAIAGHKNIEIVAQVETTWKPELALTATENALQAHPDLNAIFCPWNGCLQGVFSVLEKNQKLKKVGEEGHITIATIDGTPLGCQSIRDGLIDIDIATPLPAMGEKAVAAALKAMKGEKVEPQVEFLPGVPYTPANVGEVGSQIWGCN